MPLILILFVGVVAGWIFTKLSIILAQWLRIKDFPGARSSHSVPTPRLGGFGFFAPLLVASCLCLLRNCQNMDDNCLVLLDSIIVGGSICFFFGLMDDLKGLNPIVKLFLQMICSIVPVFLGMRIHSIALFAGLIPSPALGAALAFLWVLLVINAFNFMDGMNGMAGTFALVVMIFLAIIAGGSVIFPVLRLFVLLAGALIGFLIFNLTPARTFMGDCGSQFLGYVIAVVPLFLHNGNPVKFPFGASAILLLPFIYDVLFTLIWRLLRGENIMQAHRSHLYQRLLIAGWTHPAVLRLVFITYVLCGFFAFAFARSQHFSQRLLLSLAALAIMIIYTFFVVRQEQTEKKK